MKQIEGYHFTGNGLRNGEPVPPVGKWLKHTGRISPCESGLHMSEHPFDALQYAPGNIIHKVILKGDLKPHGNPVDKWVGRERLIIASLDITDLLREAARSWALDVIHLWPAPKIVIDYLNTGDESIRAAAWDAGRDAWAAAWAAAWDATGAARAVARAAWAAAGKKQREEFLQAVEAEFIIRRTT